SGGSLLLLRRSLGGGLLRRLRRRRWRSSGRRRSSRSRGRSRHDRRRLRDRLAGLLHVGLVVLHRPVLRGNLVLLGLGCGGGILGLLLLGGRLGLLVGRRRRRNLGRGEIGREHRGSDQQREGLACHGQSPIAGWAAPETNFSG